MRLVVLGAPCSGKTTVARALRDRSVPVVDVDDEVTRRNGGTWPDRDTKNRLLRLVLEEAAAAETVVVLNSYLFVDDTRWLRERGVAIVLLDVVPAELRRRDDVRLAAEGWTNREWAGWHQEVIAEHFALGLVDHRVDGGRSPDAVADALAALAVPPT